MKTLIFLVLFASTFSSAFAGTECSDMANSDGIRRCLDFRTEVAESLLVTNIDSIDDLLSRKDESQAKKLMATQKAWMQLRNANCGFAVGKSTGDEGGFTEVSCRLSETLKRVHELEDILEDLKSGSNKSFREAIDGLVEVRDPTVSARKIANPFGVSLINREFAAAQNALMGSAAVKANQLRIKSLRIIDEGSASVCGKASVYIAELGYFAQKTQKYVKIYVLSDLNKDRTVKAIKTSVQENIESDPVCPQ